jgi:hypothetical protein
MHYITRELYKKEQKHRIEAKLPVEHATRYAYSQAISMLFFIVNITVGEALLLALLILFASINTQWYVQKGSQYLSVNICQCYRAVFAAYYHGNF